MVFLINLKFAYNCAPYFSIRYLGQAYTTVRAPCLGERPGGSCLGFSPSPASYKLCDLEQVPNLSEPRFLLLSLEDKSGASSGVWEVEVTLEACTRLV